MGDVKIEPTTDAALTPPPDLAAVPSRRFKPEPLLFPLELSPDFFTAQAPQPEPSTQSLPPAPVRPSRASNAYAPSPPRYNQSVYVWPSPFYYSPFFMTSHEQFLRNSGQRLPGISYGSDALWYEGYEQARRETMERRR